MEKSENAIQAEIYRWYWNNYCLPHHSPRGLIMSIPNGGTRNIREAMTLKSTGLYPGASDLIVIHKKKLLYIEVKTEKGNQSEQQLKFQRHAENTGLGEYFIIRSLDEFQNLINYF